MRIPFEINNWYYVWLLEDSSKIGGFVYITNLEKTPDDVIKWKADFRVAEGCRRAKLGKIHYLFYKNFSPEKKGYIAPEDCELVNDTTSTLYAVRASKEFIDTYNCPEEVEWFNISSNHGTAVYYDVINSVDKFIEGDKSEV